MSQRVTLKAISERCGVSHVAVGAALGTLASNSRVRLSPEKAEEIQRVACEMGYQENKLAQALRAKRTQTVGVLLRVVSNSQPVSYLIDCLHRELQKRDYYAHLWPYHARFSLLERGIRDLAGWQVDGLIISHLFATDDQAGEWPVLEKWLRQRNLPVVMVESSLAPQQPMPALNIDLCGAAAQAARYLGEKGHKHLAFVGPGTGVDSLRYQAARDAVQDLQVDFLKLEVSRASSPPLELVETAMELGATLAGSANRPTGFICSNDSSGSALCTSLQAHGVRVPQEASIIGFDNAEASMLCSPALTTFAPPMEQLASRAVKRLLEAIEDGRSDTTSILLPATFIERASAGPH